MFRKLKAHEIDCRVQSITEKGAVMLLYKDARCDMNILDETIGAMYWKREHTRENQNCIVSIYNHDIKEWISKEDTGTESNTEKEKGLASDSFKRACFNWGIGRELYTAGFIYIKADKMDIKNNNGKCSTFDKFQVKYIDYDENGSISALQIVNQRGEEVFSRGSEKKKNQEPSKQVNEKVTTTEKKVEHTTSESQMKRLMTIAQKNGWISEEVKTEYCKKYNIKSGLEMTTKQYNDTVEYFEKHKKGDVE